MNMTEIRRRIANLSPEKRVLLEQQLAAYHSSLSRDDCIHAAATVDPPPASFSQRRLWFLSQLEPGSSAYNLPKAFKIAGPLDVDALRKSLNKLLQRHQVLRTRFTWMAGDLFQVIGTERSLELPIHDLSGVPPGEREAEAEFLVVEQSQQPFNLSNDLMLRAGLIRLDELHHVLLLVTHHVASDGWSTGVLWSELAALYEAFIAGPQPSLPALAIQYADFATWQRRRLQGETLEHLLNYWRQQLAGAPSNLTMPTDRPGLLFSPIAAPVSPSCCRLLYRNRLRSSVVRKV